MSVVLILGSGPNVVACRDWPKAPFASIVAINNAWAVRPDWDFLIHPDDFPQARKPVDLRAEQQIIRAEAYVPVQNDYGGFVYAGGTMAFTAGYWALGALRPRILAFLGCDMVYGSAGATHFYGQGTADPLRRDVTLRSLPAKSARLMAFAGMQGCAVVNLSPQDSQLVFPRATADKVAAATPAAMDEALINEALHQEQRLGYRVPSGKYWKEESRFDPSEIDALDRLWLRSAYAAETGRADPSLVALQYG